MQYDEIILKYVQGGLSKNIQWLIDNLQKDVEVTTEISREKCALLKLMNSINDQIEEFVSDCGDDARNNQDDKTLFGDDDIVVSPNGTSTTFMDDEEQQEQDENPSDDQSLGFDDFDDGVDTDDDV